MEAEGWYQVSVRHKVLVKMEIWLGAWLPLSPLDSLA